MKVVDTITGVKACYKPEQIILLYICPLCQEASRQTLNTLLKDGSAVCEDCDTGMDLMTRGVVVLE